MPEKAIWIGGHTLSWDARCSGIYTGFGIGVLYHFVLDKKAKYLPPLIILLTASALFLPMALDVLSVKYLFRAPSNNLKFLTGLLFGQTSSLYLYPAFISLAVRGGYGRAAIDSWYKCIGLTVITSGVWAFRFLDRLAAYYALETLAFFGCLSFYAIAMIGIFKLFDMVRRHNWQTN